jgi:hypothetical protein
MNDTEILNKLIRDLRNGIIINEDWQREELICRIKIERIKEKHAKQMAAIGPKPQHRAERRKDDDDKIPFDIDNPHVVPCHTRNNDVIEVAGYPTHYEAHIDKGGRVTYTPISRKHETL